MTCLQPEIEEGQHTSGWRDVSFCPGELLLHAVFHPENCVQRADGSYEMKDNALRFKEFERIAEGEINGISFFRTDLPHGRQVWRRITSLARKSPKRKVIFATFCAFEDLNGFIFKTSDGFQIEFEFIFDANENNKTHALLCTKQELSCIVDKQKRVVGIVCSDGRSIGEAQILFLRRRIVSILSPLAALPDLIDKVIFDTCDGGCSQLCRPLPFER